MKKEIENVAKKVVSDIASKPISRKEAIKKTGYMAVSAATMMILLSDPAHAGGGKGKGKGGGHGSGPGGSHCTSNDQQVKPAPSKGGSNQGGIWK
ncbi:MAG: hypothetical protein Q8M67_03975 [Bacteroidota bacterium]|nr:hypothetical protein [Bacteroidota bacterium]